MSCKQIPFALLMRLADGELRGLKAFTLRRHLKRCPECTQTLSELGRVDTLLKSTDHFPMETRQKALPLRPIGLVSGAALLAGAALLFAVPGGPLRPIPSFASVEEAMGKIQTVHWTETSVTQAVWMFRPGSPSGSPSGHMKESASPQSSRWDCWARLDSPRLVQKAILERDKNADMRLFINPDSQWLYERSKFSFSYMKFPTYLSREQTIRQRILDQVLLPQDSPGKARQAAASVKQQKVSFSPWRRSEAPLNGKSVLVFQREQRQRNGEKEEVLTQKITVWVDKKTLRILRREEVMPSPRGKGFLFKRTAENFRYNELAPSQIFELPKPRVGESYRFIDMFALRKDKPAYEKAGREVIQKALATYSHRDSEAFLRLWDWEALSEVQRTTRQAQWREAVSGQTPYTSWRYGTQHTGFSSGFEHLCKQDREPFPPAYPTIDVALDSWVTTAKRAVPHRSQAVFSLTKRSGQWKIQNLTLSKDPLPALWLKGKH